MRETWPHKKWNPFRQLDPHTGIFLTVPIPLAGYAAHLSAGVLAIPWMGGFFGENKNNEDKVLADGMPIVSREHEPKVLVAPHINLFPFVPATPNVLIPLLLLGSSSKCEFAVGSVQAKDGAVAVSIGRWNGVNLSCDDPFNLPTCETFNWGTVILGMTKGDMVAGFLLIGFDLLKSWIENAVFGKVFEKLLPRGALKGQMTSLLDWRKIPTIFLDDAGKPDLLPGSLGADTLEGLFKYIYGKTVGGSYGEGWADWLPIKLLSGEPVGDSIEDLGAWIDGRAEYLPTSPEPPAEPQVLPSTASPAPTPAPTPGPFTDPGTGTPTGGPTATPAGAPIAPPAQAAPVAIPGPSAPVVPPPPAPGPLMPTPPPVAAPINVPTPTDVPSPPPATPEIPPPPQGTPIMTPTPTPPPTGTPTPTPKPDK